MIRPLDSPLPDLDQYLRQVSLIFRKDGWLQQALGLEHRPQQERMAECVAASLAGGTPLLFEAGTGVGKSLAYLVPGLMHAILTGRPMVLSTHTISLQEQILRKDIELARLLFERTPELHAHARFEAALLLGRRNYLCPPRLVQAIQTQGDLFHSEEQQELERLAEWAAQTRQGLYEELSPPPKPEVWDWVNADSSLSTPQTPECFYQKARAQIRKAQVIIVNHSLLFSLIHAGAGPAGEVPGVLFPGDCVVLDEAHRIPDIATDHFGDTLSSAGLERTLKMLYNPKRKKGLVTRADPLLRQLVVRALDAAEHFFNTLRQTWLEKNDTVRLRTPDWGEATLLPPLRELANALANAAQRTENERLKEELLDYKRRLNGAETVLAQALALSEEDHVYWLEKTGVKGRHVTLRSAPLDVANALRQTLFERQSPVILTSATLTAGTRGMEPFRERTGAWGVEDEVVASPFDYPSQCALYIAEDAPNPAPAQGRLDLDYLADMILSCAMQFQGGTLALFTSHSDLRQVAARLRTPWEEAGRPLLVQGETLSRTAMTQRFAEEGHALMLGADSFWTGVDIPGAALSQVILTRLPFDPPTHPIAEARGEWLRQRGHSPFAEYTLPEAIIRFRQGIGRLIRSRSDHGTITILDSRVLHKEYGRHFIAALPHPHYVRFACATRSERFRPHECPH